LTKSSTDAKAADGVGGFKLVEQRYPAVIDVLDGMMLSPEVKLSQPWPVGRLAHLLAQGQIMSLPSTEPLGSAARVHLDRRVSFDFRGLPSSAA
jgi:hypothetical protein